MKKHILVVSQYFYPEQFRINDICRELVKRGHKVSVLTGIPNYPEGRYYKGYHFFSRNEQIDGIDIIRIPLLPRGKGKIGLVCNYVSFVVSGYIWKVLTKLEADVVFIYEVSPMTQALPGIWYGKKKKIPTILYVMDLWPENVQIVGGIHNPFILARLNKMVDSIYKQVDQILTSSTSFLKKIHQRGVKQEKLLFWPQYAEDYYTPVKERVENEIVHRGQLNITFAGNIGQAQGLSILPIAASRLKEKGITVVFNLIGEGRYKDRLIEEIKEQQVEEYFHFIGRKQPQEIPSYFANSDASLISLSPNELFEMTIPAKLQSTMACGIPILASLNGEAAEIIQTAQAGLVSEAGNVDDLVTNIIRFISLTDKERARLGQNARDYAERHYNRKRLVDQLESRLFRK